MTEDQILSPLTPTSWIRARLREDDALCALLGDQRGTNWGAGNALAPIYKAGEVPPTHPARFVVVKPPLHHPTTYYACLAPRSMDSTFLVWAETQSDKLPPGLDLDGILDPIYRRLIHNLNGVQIPDALGGYVLQAEIVDTYTPLPLEISTNVKVGQMGIQLALLSTV